jgi:hypothetical protein
MFNHWSLLTKPLVLEDDLLTHWHTNISVLFSAEADQLVL